MQFTYPSILSLTTNVRDRASTSNIPTGGRPILAARGLGFCSFALQVSLLAWSGTTKHNGLLPDYFPPEPDLVPYLAPVRHSDFRVAMALPVPVPFGGWSRLSLS